MQKKRLITAALPYVNNAPHLGNIIGCVLSADVYARFCRLKGYETLYICGTDGYGTATETKAKAEGLQPSEICEKYHKIHTAVYNFFNIKFDAFGKTFSPGHTDVVQDMYRDLDKEGYLEEKEANQTFCSPCNKFLADRYVEGTCPHCKYEHARGDQCEHCGKLLNPEELLDSKCAACGSTPELRKTKHLYLKLADLSDKLNTWVDSAMDKGHWTNNAKTTTKSWIKKGLNSRPITRDLKWGIPVPRDGYENKVFYVWFDAPIGYISITKEFFPNDWEKWWLEPESTNLYQFLGKDNIPFHSVVFPSTLLGSGKNWTMVHHMNSTEFLNYENTKFSKSKGVGIFGTDAIDLDFPADLWRFYLLSSRPEKQDANFMWEEFFDKVNNELIDNICNLVNRVLVYHNKNFPGTIQQVEFKSPDHTQFIEQAKILIDQTANFYEKGELKEAAKSIVTAGKLANKFFQDQEPWKKIKEDRDSVEKTMAILVHFVRDLGVMLLPIIPETAQKITTMVGSPDSCWKDLGDFNNLAGKSLGTVELLLNKIDPKNIKPLKARFGDKDAGFEQLELRVGRILSVKQHPEKDHLYIEEIDIGAEKPITVVSALCKNYSISELNNRQVLVVTNLEPADFSGTESQGMVLIAQKGKKVELLSDDSWPTGAEIFREGYETKKDRKSVSFKDFQKLTITVKDNQVLADDEPLLVSKGVPVKSKLLAIGKIK